MTPSPDVIQFTCHSCGMALTVPIQLAGITGPCPQCQASITSPSAPVAVASPYGAPVPVQQAPVMPAPPQPQWNLQQPGGLPAMPMPQAPMPQQPHLLNHLLQSSTAPTMGDAAPAAVAPAPLEAPTRRRSKAAPEGAPKGAFAIALLMAMLVLAGVAFFFQEQLKAAWVNYQLQKQSAEEPAETVLQPVKPAAPEPQAPPPGSVPFTPEAPPAKVTAEPPAPLPNLENLPSVTAPLMPEVGMPPKALLAETPPMPPMPAATDIPPGTTAKVMVPDAAASLVEVPPVIEPGIPLNGNPKTIEPPRAYLNVTPETQPAVDALEKFFAAPNWKERVKYVQSPDQMQPLMEKYYSSNLDEAVNVSRIQMIRLDPTPETGGPPHAVLQVSGGGLQVPLPVMVESSPDGWKVDWLTFTEFKDELLQKFLESYVEVPARFHVMIRRTHYFDDDVPEMDKKICYEIKPPMPGYHGYAFATKGSELGRELDHNLGWEVGTAAVIVELQWRKQDRYQWVELTALPQYNWRNPVPQKGLKVETDQGMAEPNMTPPPAGAKSPGMELKTKPKAKP
jgi:hypothetical protein